MKNQIFLHINNLFYFRNSINCYLYTENFNKIFRNLTLEFSALVFFNSHDIGKFITLRRRSFLFLENTKSSGKGERSDGVDESAE